jgi:hypothetical protein
MWLSACILMAACGFSAEEPSPAKAPPALHAYQGRLRTLLREEAECRDARRRAALIAAMCQLHQQIVADPRFATSPTLQEYRVQLWSRLRKIKTELAPPAKAERALARGRGTAFPATDPLATLQGADAEVLAAADMSACALMLATQAAGGPAIAVLGYGGAAVPPDYGPALVALIERTINPAFWDVNGGPGSIVYYAPLHCLVVRATAEVHGQVGGLVEGLRAAGR